MWLSAWHMEQWVPSSAEAGGTGWLDAGPAQGSPALCSFTSLLHTQPWAQQSEWGGGVKGRRRRPCCLRLAGRPDPPRRAKGSPGVSRVVSGAGTDHLPRLLGKLQPWRSGLRMGQAGGPWTQVCSGLPAPAQQATHSHPPLQVLVWEGAWRPRGLRLPRPHHPRAAGRWGCDGLGTGPTARTHPSEIRGKDVVWRGPCTRCAHAPASLLFPSWLSRLPDF